MVAGSPLNALLGICAPYKQIECTYVACRIARWAARACVPFTFFSAPKPRPAVDTAIDSYVMDSSTHDFSRWLEDSTAIVWVGFPNYEQVAYVTKHLRKKTILFTDPHSIDPEDRHTLELVDKVVTPSKRLHKVLTKRWKLDNVMHCPYDCGLKPQSRIGLRSKLLRVAVPIIDEYAAFSELDFIYQLHSLLKSYSNICFRLILSPGKLNSSAKKRLRILSRLSGDRFELCRALPFSQRIKQLLDVDLVVWPSVQSGVGCYLNLCATAGVPVVCFDTPPNDEIIGETGGYLVPVPYVAEHNLRWQSLPDYDRFTAKIAELMENPRALRTKSKNIQITIQNRVNGFDAVFNELFGAVL
jgi:glycosyltransferase involved in cell wall biosynthesis